MKILIVILSLITLNIFAKPECYKVDGMVCGICSGKIETAYSDLKAFHKYFSLEKVSPPDSETKTPGKVCINVLSKPEKTKKLLSVILKKAGTQYELKEKMD